MQLNKETLEKVERMGAAAFTAKEMAVVLELPPDDVKAWLNDENHALSRAYNKGLLMRQLEVRERIFKDAKNGSSPAQAMAVKLLEGAAIHKLLP